MASLTTSLNDLSPANASVNARHREIPPLRGVQGDNFSSGQINYRWELGANQRMCMAKSYIRCRFRITREDGTQLTVSDDVAPAHGFCSHLFKSAEFRIGQQTIERVSDNMARVDALKTRIRKSKSWIDSVGKSTNFWDCDFGKRQLDVVREEDIPDATSIRTVTPEDAGFAAGTTVEYTAADNLLTFSAPNFGKVNVGDVVIVDETAFPVLDVVNGTQVLTDNNILVDVAATADFLVSKLEKKLDCEVEPKRAVDHEVIWQPPMSIFEHSEGLPTGRYELSLSPNNVNDFKQRCVQSLFENKIPGDDFDIQIQDLNLYIYQYDSERVTDTTYYIDLDNVRAQRETLDNANDQMKNFDVAPSTYALTLAIGDTRSYTNTQFPESFFRGDGSDKLQSFYISYAGQQQPSPDARLDLTANKYQVAQVYTDTLMHTGSYYDSGGSEPLAEWRNRGQYYTYLFERDGTDRSSRVSLKLVFESIPTNSEVMLFDHYKSVVSVRIENGLTTNVSIAEQ